MIDKFKVSVISLVVVVPILLLRCNDRHNQNKTKNFSMKVNIALSMIDSIQFQKTTPFIQFIKMRYSPTGDIFVIDSRQNKIAIYSDKGGLKHIFGAKGQGPGEFIRINGITWDEQGNVYICDGITRRISKFDTTGKFLGIIYHFGKEYFLNDGKIYLLNDSLLFVGAMQRKNVRPYQYTKSHIFTALKFNSWENIGWGGRFIEKFKYPGFSSLLGRDFTVNSDGIFAVQTLSPYLFHFSYSFKKQQKLGITGAHYNEINDPIKGIATVSKLKQMAKKYYGKSIMLNIRNYQNYLLAMYFNRYIQYTRDGNLIYKGNSRKSNEYWCQVYSENGEEYYGEVQLPGKFMACSSKNIIIRAFDKKGLPTNRYYTYHINIQSK